MLPRILALIARPQVLLVGGTLLLLALVWFGGGLLHSAIDWPPPWLTVVLCVLVVLGAVAMVLLRLLRARRQAQAIERELRAQAQAQAASSPLPERGADIAALQRRFDDALEALKQSKLGRGALYALPWYVIIGPPGSGKTTAITESGLNFPAVKGSTQKRGIRGLGGTRNCDWWFTDQAILLDTAGRYTTEAEDHDEWLAFLGMIKRARKLKPINGVMVAISITDVLTANDEGLERHAQTIRRRIDELVKQLEVVFPVYLVFTKCDLLDGFVEFFSSLSKEARGQVWGATFDRVDVAAGSLRQRFAAECELLCERVGRERLRLLVPDRPHVQQRKIFSLALQLNASRKRLGEFIDLLTQPNPYSEASPLRGFYFTSGTQEGAPIDQVMQRLASAHGIKVADKDEAVAVEAKSYFVRDLFTKVMVADRELARSSAAVQRRREWTRRVTMAGSAVAAVLLAVASIGSYSTTSGLVDDLDQAVVAARNKPLATASEPAAVSEARHALDVLRERYVALQEAYRGTSVLGPSSDTVLAALGEYVGHLRPVFLEPIRDDVEAQLEAFLAAPTQRDFAEVKQLLTVHAALADQYVDAAELDAALRARSLWRWTRPEIGKQAQFAPEDPLLRHLAAFVQSRAFQARIGRSVPLAVAVNPSLPERARSKLLEGPGLQAFAARTLRQNRELRWITDADLVARARRIYEQTVGKLGSAEIEQFDAAFTTQRKSEVLEELSRLGLHDTASIRTAIASLDDLSAPTSEPVQLFQQLLQGLRNAGAAPSAGAANDPVVTLYLGALQQLEGLKETLQDLEEQRQRGGVVLPDIRAGKPPLAAFLAKLDEVAKAIDGKLRELEKEIASQNEEPGRVYHPIKASIDRMRGSIVQAVARQVRSEITDDWRGRLGTQLAVDLQQFPFTAAAERSLSVAGFKALFERGGQIDQQLKIVDQASSIRLLAQDLAPSSEYQRFRQQCVAIQRAFFGEAEQRAEPALQFRIALLDSNTVISDVILMLVPGGEIRKRGTRRERIHQEIRAWPLGTTATQVVHETTLASKETFSVVSGERDSPWSLLRVLAKGEPTRQEGGTRVTWSHDYKGEDGIKKKAQSWIVFEPLSSVDPFEAGFFALSPLQELFQADRTGAR